MFDMIKNIGGPIKAVERVGGDEAEKGESTDGQIYNVEVSLRTSCDTNEQQQSDQVEAAGMVNVLAQGLELASESGQHAVEVSSVLPTFIDIR